MIRFSLHCDEGHEFDGWFGSSSDYNTQRKRGLVTCPVCNSMKVEKSLMAPAVASKRKEGSMPARGQMMVPPHQQAMMQKLRELRDAVVSSSENVGRKFPEEARKIHYGESEGRPIIGEATGEEARALIEEGVGIAPLPHLPEDAN